MPASASAAAVSTAISSGFTPEQIEVIRGIVVPLTGTWMTVMVGLIGGLIAYGQWKISRTKLKFDLFEKRLAIFDAARALVRDDFYEANDPDSDEWERIIDLSDRLSGARWLLNQEAVPILDSLVAEARERLRSRALTKRPPAGTNMVAMNRERVRQLRERQHEDMRKLYAIFDPFLSINPK